MCGPSILGGFGGGIINAGGSLLDAGRRIDRSGIGMSASSRGLLEGFYSGGIALFNQLYTKTENAEVANATTILALRSKYSYLVSEEVKATAASNTTGTNVDTTA